MEVYCDTQTNIPKGMKEVHCDTQTNILKGMKEVYCAHVLISWQASEMCTSQDYSAGGPAKIKESLNYILIFKFETQFSKS